MAAEVLGMIELVELIISKAVITAAEEDIAQATPLLGQMLMAFPAAIRNAIDVSTTLWAQLNEQIWGCTGNKAKYVEHFRVYRNFFNSNSMYFETNLGSQQICRSIELLGNWIACGFTDGSIQVFRYNDADDDDDDNDNDDDDMLQAFRNYDAYTLNRPPLGPYSWSVVGIILELVPSLQLTYGCMDGTIFQADVSREEDLDVNSVMYQGNLLIDGSMMDFTGTQFGWVALYAGVPGRSFRVWNPNMQIIYTGGNFTDLDAAMGIQMVNIDPANMEPVRAGRVIMIHSIIIGCTERELVRFDVTDPPQSVTPVLNHEIFEGERAIVETLSWNSHSFVVATTNWLVTVRRIQSFEVTHRIRTFQAGGVAYMGVQKRHFTILCFTSGRIYPYDSQREQLDLQVFDNRRLTPHQEAFTDILALATNYKYLAATTLGVLHFWVHSV